MEWWLDLSRRQLKEAMRFIQISMSIACDNYIFKSMEALLILLHTFIKNEFVITYICSWLTALPAIPIVLTNSNEMKNVIFEYMSVFHVHWWLTDPHPAWQPWGFTVFRARREVTVSEKSISVPGFACLEGVPSPRQAGRDEDKSVFSEASKRSFRGLALPS